MYRIYIVYHDESVRTWTTPTPWEELKDFDIKGCKRLTVTQLVTIDPLQLKLL